VEFSRSWQPEHSFKKRFDLSSAWWFGIGAGSILRKSALIQFDAPVLGVAVAYTASLLPFLIMLVSSASIRKELSLKRDVRLFWAAGVGQAITWMLSFYAKFR